jgi:acyl-CoA oxidase
LLAFCQVKSQASFDECPGSDVLHWGGHRLATVTKEGKYIRSNKPRQLGYGAMVFVRQGIVTDASIYLSRAVTIAVRYSAIRRQFGAKDDKPEVQV